VAFRTPSDEHADGCTNAAWIDLEGRSAKVTGQLADRGARALAEGTVGRDDQGDIVSYTVASGDAPDAIGDRLCIENAPLVAALNHTRTIQPGQVLRLALDPTVPWIPYFNPADAPAGFPQALDAGHLDVLQQMFS
jgi:hypothetical protein